MLDDPESTKQIFDLIQKLEAEIHENKSISKISPETDISKTLSEDDKKFVKEIDHEYYSRVRSSETFYRRKKLILENLQRLHNKVEHQAKTWDDFKKLNFIVLEKAFQKKSIVKQFMKPTNNH